MHLLSQRGVFGNGVLISEASHRREWIMRDVLDTMTRKPTRLVLGGVRRAGLMAVKSIAITTRFVPFIGNSDILDNLILVQELAGLVAVRK